MLSPHIRRFLFLTLGLIFDVFVISIAEGESNVRVSILRPYSKSLVSRNIRSVTTLI